MYHILVLKAEKELTGRKKKKRALKAEEVIGPLEQDMSFSLDIFVGDKNLTFFFLTI